MPEKPSNDTRFITLAIHTYDKAHDLKSLLEGEGIEVALQNVNLQSPEISAGVRVRIHESDLPFALRIVENPEIFRTDSGLSELIESKELLVPVDFSEHSDQACRYAFSIADRHGLRIHILHAYVDPSLTNSLQLSQSLSYEIDETEESLDILKIANARMSEYVKTLRSRIRQGELPPVKFSYEVTEGVPEEAILRVAKDRCPTIIVMGTRGAGAKARELVGSVTAEVLDSCRFPLFTVPEKSVDHVDVSSPKVMMFVSLDQEDFLALDALLRFMPPRPDISISFVKLEKNNVAYQNNNAFTALLSYAEQHYPQCHFSIAVSSVEGLLDEFSKSGNVDPDLIVVQNKKKNVFARFFNPGIAHRLLFHSDIPMMVIPV